MRAGLHVAFVFAVSVLAAGPLHAQTAPAAATGSKADSATVDTTQGYARILFTFATPAPVTATVADGVVTIRLGRPVTTNIDTFTESLGPYVSGGRRDSDGLTYRFALRKPVSLHNSTQMNQTAVDLVPESFKGVPPDLPPPPPPVVKGKALPDLTKLPVIKLRIGEYSNFTRLVFDWPTIVAYTAYPGQGRIQLRFETAARPDFSVMDSRKPAWVKSAGWHLDDTATVVEFETDAESSFHDFRDGAKIVIDVLAPKTDASAYAPPGGTAIKPAITALPNPPPKGSDAAAALNPAALPAVPPPPAAAAKAPAPAPILAEIPNPSAELTHDGAVLHFPAAHGRPAAVFMRGETLWIVLEGHPPIDAASLLAPLTNLIRKAQAEQSFGATVMKIILKTPLLAFVGESDAALNVTLTATGTTPPDAVAFTRQGADGQTTLTTPLPGAIHVLQFADADAGDHLFVVPARPGKAVLTPKRFVEMEALATSAGIAIVPFTDDLGAQVQSEIVTVSRPKGLALSSASGANTEPVVQLLTSKQGPAFIDFTQWGQADSEDVIVATRNLRGAVAHLPESEGNKARLRLARYLLAHRLAPEALGEIQLIQAADAKLASDPGLSAMKGAAQFMMGRYGDARVSLSDGKLTADPHAALWRGMAEAKLGDFANARHDLAVSQSVLRFYPEEWETQARLARAETGLAQGDLASANDALDQLSPQLSPRESVEARLYEAQLLAAQSHMNEAISRLRNLEQTDYAPVAVKATYARVEIELAAKKIKPDEAIKAYEQLRYRWRGDDLELKILRKLGSLYFAQGNWRGGFTVLSVASLNFPKADLARSAQDDMRRAFNDLFLGDKADAMRPIDALALFYDFIDLTPIGRDGDEMIRRLTDRLVAIDLLAPAEQLLDHQVKERLDGVARASVATKLAMIYLLDHKPKEALATINDTRQTRLPDDLNEQRRLLEARALAGMKQFDAAIDLIADDDTPQAKRLRADMAWDSGNWTSAGAKAEDVVGDRWNASGPLNDEERAQIMRAAVAYSLGNDQPALDRLREHYAAKMNASPDAKAFAIVTDRIDRQGGEFRDLVKRIAAVDTLQAFMADFKKQGAATKTAQK
jgi:tetratricopeptide (TPR) repeat protein